MKIVWADGGKIHRAFLESPITITTREFGGGTRPYKTYDMGYITKDKYSDGRWLANVYGTINPDSPSRLFDDLEEAKAYVETQALLGIAINKLTR